MANPPGSASEGALPPTKGQHKINNFTSIKELLLPLTKTHVRKYACELTLSLPNALMAGGEIP
jgi:hypothetical protein